MAVLTLAELKRHLGTKAPDSEADLSALITAAEAWAANRCGPLEPTPATVRVRGGRSLVVPGPVISVTSVTARSGAVVDAGSYYLLGDSGVIASDNGFAEDFYDVVYSAGRTACPADLKEAVKEKARDIWMPRRGPAAGIAGSEPSNAGRRADELSAPYARPGFD